jgi:hypothetical protein
VAYQIRMIPEVEQWLAEVRDHDPAAADVIDEAVAALRAGGEHVAAPLVVPIEDPAPAGPVRTGSRPEARTARLRKARSARSVSGAARWLLAKTALPGLEAAYQQHLAALTPVRRAVADVATARKRLELQIAQLEQRVSGPAGDAGPSAEPDQGGAAQEGEAAQEEEARPETIEERLADLRRRYAELQAEEERVMLASQRLQAKLDTFRASAEAVRAAHTAAAEAAEAVWAEMTGEAGAGADGAGALADAEDAGPDGEPSPARPASWLSELRPGAPEAVCAHILFTVEPSGTAVLLAAGTETDCLNAWYAEAAARSRIRYRRERGTRLRPAS